MATGAQNWDEILGNLVHTYWATVETIAALSKARGYTNAQFQTLATAILANRAAVPGKANSTHLAVAAGLAANNWS
jgi:hypothetical protein